MRVQGSSSSERHRRSSRITLTPHVRSCMKFATTATLCNVNGDHDIIDTTTLRPIPSKRRKRQLTNNNSCDSLDCRNIVIDEPQEMTDENLSYCNHIEPPYFPRHRRLQQVNDFISYKNIDYEKSNNGDMKSNSIHSNIKTTAASISQLKQKQAKQAPPEIVVPIEKIQIVPLYHGYGTYYIDLWCGTPIPQHQTMIVDTGSSTTAMTCLPDCTPSRCGQIRQYHPVYIPHQSSTYQKVTKCQDCTVGNCVKVVKMVNAHETDSKNINNTESTEYECIWNAAYQEGSNWTAFEAMDQCYIGGHRTTPIRLLQESTSLRGRNKMSIGNVRNDNNTTSSINTNIGINPNLAATHHQFRLQFGCQTSLYGNFRTQDTSGIMGLNVGSTAIWNQMYQQQIISKRAFSICIQPSQSPLHHSSTSGIMTLGGTHTPIHHHTMVYAQRHYNAGDSGIGLYMIKLQNIYLSPLTTNFAASNTRIDPSMLQKISIPNTQDFVRNVIIDSGTTDTYFAEQLGQPFRTAWLELYGIPYTNEPMELTEDELKQLPTIVLQFQGHVDSNKELLNDPAAREFLTSYVDTDNPYDVLLVIPPSIYMEHDDGMYKSSVYFDEPDNNVFGANIMANHDIHFDIEFHRIGFAESACNYTRLVTPYSVHTKSIDHANAAAQTGIASVLQLHPALLTATFSMYDIWRPAAFLVFALAAIGLLHLILAIRKTTTVMNTNIAFGTERVSNIRRGRRRRQPQQNDQPIIHRMQMVVRSISRDRSEFTSRMRQLPNASPPTYSFTENNEPRKLSQSTSVDDDDAAAITRINKENCSTTTTREVRRGTNILRSRSYQISFRDGT